MYLPYFSCAVVPFILAADLLMRIMISLSNSYLAINSIEIIVVIILVRLATYLCCSSLTPTKLLKLESYRHQLVLVMAALTKKVQYDLPIWSVLSDSSSCDFCDLKGVTIILRLNEVCVVFYDFRVYKERFTVLLFILVILFLSDP